MDFIKRPMATDTDFRTTGIRPIFLVPGAVQFMSKHAGSDIFKDASGKGKDTFRMGVVKEISLIRFPMSVLDIETTQPSFVQDG